MNWKALWEAVKEPLRLLLLALVSFAITQLLALENPAQWTILAVFVLRFVDKFLHEWGKEAGKEGWLRSKGLTYF